MKLEQDQISTIIENHIETVDSLKAERDKYKADAEKLEAVQSELDKAKAKVVELTDNEEWKTKYEALNGEFESYKTEQSNKATRQAQEKAFVEALKEAGVSDKMLGMILDTKKADAIIGAIAFDKDGNVKGLDGLSKQITTDYADYISTSNTTGATTITPPKNDGVILTKAQIYETDEKGRYKLNTQQRQEALMKLNSKGD